jgi:peptide/nickel transport system substrate-binding protein
MAVAALLLAAGAFAIPQHAAAQAFGGYADSLVFSVVPQDQAVASVSSGEIDMYVFPLDAATDMQAARDDPNINVMEALGGFRGMLVNPVAPADGSFNPFTIREIREAMHWTYDREVLAGEIAGGFAIPMTLPYVRFEPEYLRDYGFFSTLEAQYSYDRARAKAQVDAAMSQVSNATFDTATNQWLVDGNQIEIIIIQRVEDFRFEIGAYVATEIQALGFTPVLDPSTFVEALTKVYFSDAKLGQWHMYTEGWGGPGFVLFDDERAPFLFLGDFGSAIWVHYTPPPSLEIACSSLRDGLYTTPGERRDLLRRCVAEGMREGIRHFLLMDIEVYAFNWRLSNTVVSRFSGLLNPFAVRTTIKEGQPGGTLYIGQPIHTGSAWNQYGGFQDVYSRIQSFQITDFGTATHPHLGGAIPFRTNFTISNVGPLDTHEVPTSAITFDAATNTFVNVSPGVTTGAYVDFDLKFGEWHHGEMMSMDDVVAHIAMLSRMASGDLVAQNPNNAAQIYLVRWASSFRGFEILDSERIRIWFDTYSPDESLVASRADVFPIYPWELNAIMTESALASETAFHDTDADVQFIQEMDLAKGATLALFDDRLVVHKAANTIPAFLTPWVTPAEATARWAALNEWRNPTAGGCINGPSTWTCNYMVSQGPYYLDQYFTAPEGARYTAKRTGYPIEQDAWDFLAQPQVLEVAFRSPPEVIQTFPVTFQFTTTLGGAPYDRILTAAWFLSDPATKKTLLSGNATWSGPGIWDIELSALQTTALAEGPYELNVIVVAEEIPFLGLGTLSFTSLSLSSAILREVTQVIEGALTGFQETIDENIAATQAAIDAADARVANVVNLVNLVLILAIAAMVIAVLAIVALLVVWRRLPAK